MQIRKGKLLFERDKYASGLAALGWESGLIYKTR